MPRTCRRALVFLLGCVFACAARAADPAPPAPPAWPAPKQVFTLQPDNTIDGAKIPHAPGDVFALAGKARTLRILNFKGTSERPVAFVNAGLVDVANDDRGFAIAVQGCLHVRLSGSGPVPEAQRAKDPHAARCGIRASATKKGMMAIHVNGKSSDIEVDRLEVYGAGFAGFNVKDEPNPDGSTNRDTFTMYNLSIHDNYVHDVEGEGFYIGHTFYGGYDHKPSGKTLMPHVIKGLRVYNNRTVNTGCEGIQVGSTVEDCEIYNNTLIKFGQRPFAQWQDNGMQIGGGTQAKVYNNYLEEGPGCALTIHGLGELSFFNNTLVKSGGPGAYVNTKEGTSYLFAHNTLVNCGGDGLRIGNFKDPPAAMRLYNNLIVREKQDQNQFIANLNQKAKLEEGGNVTLIGLAAAGFKNPAQGDYRPAEQPALRATVPVPQFTWTADQAGLERPKGRAPLAGAHEPPLDAKPYGPGAPLAAHPPTPWKNKR
ncbi:MAG: right-handed parallel beta-helix repeat-containing protein [Planctomycetes bacterium]|nr:right-handed parallel beta-helix repeat-containing protein [Planctomycetota bacterium]